MKILDFIPQLILSWKWDVPVSEVTSAGIRPLVVKQ